MTSPTHNHPYPYLLSHSTLLLFSVVLSSACPPLIVISQFVFNVSFFGSLKSAIENEWIIIIIIKNYILNVLIAHQLNEIKWN